MSTHPTTGPRAESNPWAFSTRELGRRPGEMRSVARVVVAPDGDEAIGIVGVLAIPGGSPIELDLRLESASEGVYVSGRVAARLVGECSRCLDGLDRPIEVRIEELFAYPESRTDETTEADELPRLVDDHVDVEQTVRDAVVVDIPLAPLCGEDCLGLCPECGERRADLGPDHRHETLDARWAALRDRFASG